MTWTDHKYFSKGQQYWTRASQQERSSDTFLLNIAFACEFIARGALCKINPMLNAASDSESLLYAAGGDPRTPPKTVDLSEALKRLQRFIPTLTKQSIETVELLVQTRNRELHSDEASFTNLKYTELMPSILSFTVAIADYCDQDLSVMLGQREAKQAREVAQALAKDRKRRVTDLIRTCKDRFFSKSKEEQQDLREKNKANYVSAVLRGGFHSLREKCPACASDSFLVAIPVGASEPYIQDDELRNEVRVVPSKFECKCCGLVIEGLDELIASGFNHEYCSFDIIDPVDHFNIDINQYVDVDEILREYHEDMYAYQDE